MNIFSRLSILSCSLLATATLSLAADPTEASGGSLEKKDLKFVTEAAQGGMLEVAAGKLAEQKASSADVKKMGEMLVKDHGKANAELMEIAKKKGVDVPLVSDRKSASVVNSLGSKEGESFDKAFVSDLEKDHKEDIEMFEEAAGKLTDPDLKAFAMKQLPVLRQHLEHIQMLKAK